MTATQAQIRRGRKFDQVLEGARAVFLTAGYEAAGVDEIARRAGVSKATLYSYFPDKRLLFLEVVRVECARQADEAMAQIDLAAPPEVVLRLGARRIVEFYCSEFGRGVARLRASESERFPELGRQFYEAGPGLARARIGSYLQAACGQGQLRIADIPLAADQFVKLCEADLHDRITCGLQTRFSEAEIARVIDGAVDMFLARHGAG
ncbi:MAG: TetR/AcrR family transcriptional regulator [Alkalilacustris sp.]